MSSATRKPRQEEWLVPAGWVGLFLLLLLPLVAFACWGQEPSDAVRGGWEGIHTFEWGLIS